MTGARLVLLAAALSGAVVSAPGRAGAGLWKPKEASKQAGPAKPAGPSKPAAGKPASQASKASKPAAKGKETGKSKTASRDKPASKTKEPARAPARGAAGSRLAAAPKGKPAEPPVAGAKVAGGKVAVFAFHGDGVEPVRRQVLNLLRSKGMKVNATLRPVDSAEQYREMATALNLVAYVDGEVNGDGPDASATVHVRSGRTGLRMASATFSGERRALAGNVGRELWNQIGGALSRACADAAKPRRGERAPMRINAGTPIADAQPPSDP